MPWRRQYWRADVEHKGRKGRLTQGNQAAHKGAFKRRDKIAVDFGLQLSYRALPGECDPAELVKAAASMGKNVAYPVCGEKGGLELYIPSDGSCFVKGAYGIAEPDRERSERITIDRIELIIVPGLAFDRDLYRLGRGGGYYDRLLNGAAAFKLGLALKEQITERVPREAWDAKMDAVACNFGIYC